MANVSPQDVTKWLMNAPKIARDTAPFFWTYLDAPADGTIMLTWQPLQRMDTNFATDGYIWAAPETYFQQDMGNGLMLEMFFQRAGYRQGEQFAAHSRRRFRLIPKQPMHGAPQVDPSLWIVHYGPNEPQDRMPANMIPIDPRTQNMLQSRMQLQRGGQIARKEFMLADRLNWPTINPPREGRGHPMMAQPPHARTIPQPMAYPPQPPAPNKRARTAAAHAAQQQLLGASHFVSYDDEDDTYQGDIFDRMTPRDISMARYTRNHEWMEEILGSAYRIGQITPADLGLGLQGDLSSLTRGIYEASGVDAHKKPPTKPVVGHLDPKLADEFRKRVSDKIENDKAEMEQMKAQHEKMMDRFKSNSILNRSEKELRFAVDETGPEFWRLEGKEEDEEENASKWNGNQHRKVDDIVAEVESALGRHIAVVSDVKRIQDGGYQEPAPEPEALPMPPAAPPAANSGGPSQPSRQPSLSGSQHSGMIGEPDIDMGGTAAGLIDQIQGGTASTSTPQGQLSTSTPANVVTPQPQAGPAQAQDNVSEDVIMQDSEQAKDKNLAPDQGTGSGDWVVVPEGGVSPGASASAAPAAPVAETTEAPAPESKPGDDFSSLGDINSAGEALDQQAADITPGADFGDIGMDDSAFGEAMYGAEESRNSAANTPTDGTI
ncbi:SWI/SNF and RSC complexes subunit ssr4 [Cytospora mali]|uniref:SWI/SNF and RSC complexes subunit ssr4 n=1 Tax=Cytospora mali TaxID=578113 RepID=A0A194VEL5_CYTMA|nr:SWI/SNF and RSC complexes subunit ssr4 [Valsa mali var. pyri (nom. inval.)]